jgi:hypothetical protein
MEEETAQEPRIRLRYFDGCPHWRLAYERLREAGLTDLDIRFEQVETQEDAERLHFVGSPTILIDGRDPFDGTEGEYGLTCRVYQTPEGLAGSPTEEQVREALRNL